MKKLSLIFALCVSAGLVSGVRAEDPAETETKPDALFEKLDTNKDGVLTASEIPQEHQKFFERLLRIGDTNKDGKLSREEFDAAMGKDETPGIDISKTPGIDAGSGPPRAKVDPQQIFRALDKNKDGKLTRDEAKGRPRIQALFDRLGKDELTLDDLKSALQGGGGKQAGKKAQKKGLARTMAEKKNETAEASSQLPAFAKLLDTNHDGRLSREELSKAAELFDRLDRNHDGFLDAKELNEMPAVASSEEPTITPAAPLARRKNGKQERNLMQILKRADTDGDGKLSMEEAPPFLKKNFAKIDTNGDGFLDKAELEAWFRRQHKLASKAGDTESPSKPESTTQNSGL
jgi:Ca2+-binding EF-hand superfamily protein